MQTNFSKAQLADQETAHADRILRRCVHCGFCTATCPTYVVLGDERDSPRGRIYAIKDMLEKGAAATPEVSTHIDRCLSCFSCMTTCPSGVDYMHLVEIARGHIEKTGSRSLKDRLIRRALAEIVPYPNRFRWAMRAAPMGRRFTSMLRAMKLPEVAAMIELAPPERPRAGRFRGPGTASPTGVRTGRVLLLAGCAQQALRPEINDATIRLFARGGIDVVVSNGAGCCGALSLHIGREEEAVRMARANVEAWSKEIAKGGVDAIIINTSGCGTTVKDYGHLLRYETEYAKRAKDIAAMTKDVSEFLDGYDIGAPKRWSSLKVAYHAACSLQHGQRVTSQPKSLLKKAGFTVVDIPESHLCCGSAGVYNILQPEIAGELRDRKTGHIKALRPDVVAAGNIGCIRQLQMGLDVPVVHTIELLDWAHGGPVPPGLENLEQYSTSVPQPKHSVEDYIGA
ncbi:glycolate oxidase iron-sulfur subunit [Hyphomicrobium methylovorum]|uniref:glycolate oxidase subunit GlcF n=1 Tax=Hyphomicrobium methylovorum TaxID=84 RepID=UPI0015E70598|nr:glycolate oxidase subunit GlcF [Hyphomicrobium methylovorum]MBA2126868.1 glycolate oxidase iron-sulfur subunit [Hyphomicrobium methylovorum]